MKNLADVKLDKYRVFDSMKSIAVILQATPKTWKTSGYSNFQEKFLLFMIEGNNFTGWACIGVNALDLFDVFLIDKHQNIVHELNHVYIDDLIEELERKVERVPVCRF